MKRKQHNQERDRQLKEQSSKRWRGSVADSEEDEEAKDPRLLPEHLFVAAFNQPPPAPGSSVPKDASQKTQHRNRKRTDPTPKDRIVGQAFSSPIEDTQLTLANSPRTIRTLSKASDLAATRRALPPSSVSKFSTRALNTKGAVHLSRLRGWQRKAGEWTPHLPVRDSVTEIYS